MANENTRSSAHVKSRPNNLLLAHFFLWMNGKAWPSQGRVPLVSQGFQKMLRRSKNRETWKSERIYQEAQDKGI